MTVQVEQPTRKKNQPSKTMRDRLSVIEYAVGLIDPSPYQARKRFREDGMTELQDSIREHGIMQPLLARPSPAAPERLELVAGERRWRGAAAVGLETVPVIVRTISDTDAEEIGLIENLQREDLSALEEAEGFARLKELKDPDGRALYTDERIAQKLGVPLMRVRMRLCLRRCPEELMTAVDEGRISVSTAGLVGRIPDGQARAAAAKEILEPSRQEVPLTRDQAKEMIRERFMIRVTKSDGFDPKDEGLLPVTLDPDTGERLWGGSCEDCPHRSGNNPDVQGDLAVAGSAEGKQTGGRTKGLDPNLCTNPGCHRKKLEAAWKRKKAAATERGQAVLEGDEAKKVFSGWQGELAYDAKYVDLDGKPGWQDVGSQGQLVDKKWRSVLKGKDGLEVVMAKHPTTGKVVELVDRKAARQALRTESTEDGKASAKDAQAKEANRKRKELEKRALGHAQEALSQIVEDVWKCGPADVGLLKLVWGLALDASGADGAQYLAQWLEVKSEKGARGRDHHDALCAHVEAVAGTDAGAWLAFVVAALLAKNMRWQGMHAAGLEPLISLLGIDVPSLVTRAEEKLGLGRSKPAKKKKAATRAA